MEVEYLKTHWNLQYLFMSFGVAFVGSYVSVSLADVFRHNSLERGKLLTPSTALILMSFSIGGVAIWCMHFTGMGAAVMYNADGAMVAKRYDLGTTILSLMSAVVFSFFGLWISTSDRTYTKDLSEISTMIAEDAKSVSIQKLRSHRHLMRMALLTGLEPLALGGIITALGVCIMHYVGMLAIRIDNVDLLFDGGVVAASVVIALVAATAAFWILFRVLSCFPNKEILRLVSSVIMSIAVCGMHYTGMAAVRYRVRSHASSVGSMGVSVGNDLFVLVSFATGLIFSFVVLLLVISEMRHWNYRDGLRLLKVSKLMRSSATMSVEAVAEHFHNIIESTASGGQSDSRGSKYESGVAGPSRTVSKILPAMEDSVGV